MLLDLSFGIRVRGEKRLSENSSWGGIELPHVSGGHSNLILGFLCSDINGLHMCACKSTFVIVY